MMRFDGIPFVCWRLRDERAGFKLYRLRSSRLSHPKRLPPMATARTRRATAPHERIRFALALLRQSSAPAQFFARRKLPTGKPFHTTLRVFVSRGKRGKRFILPLLGYLACRRSGSKTFALQGTAACVRRGKLNTLPVRLRHSPSQTALDV